MNPVKLGDGMAAMREDRVRHRVSLVLTDLPSGATAAEFDNPPCLTSFFASAEACLHPGGTIVTMCSSLSYAEKVRARCRNGWFRHDLIWVKSIATGFLNAKIAPLRAHEYILVFGRPHYYYPDMSRGHEPINSNSRSEHGTENYGGQLSGSKSRAGATDRYPTSVLIYPSVPTRAKDRTHPQQKPVELLQKLIPMYCPLGGLVFDPFAGSGSTLRAAEAEGRRCEGWDSSPRFGGLDVLESPP